MQAFLQSAFLQALGYAIANSLWQVALIWLLVLLINNIGKPASAKKYFVSVTAQFTSFVWFIATLQFYYTRCSEVLQQAQLNNSINNPATYIAAPSIDSFSSALLYATIKMELLLPYLSVAYLFMLIFLCVRFGRAFYFTREIRYKGLHKADIDIRLFVKRTASYLGIKKEVKIYFSDLVKGPLTIGFLKPLILVPVASLNHLSPDQMEAVLLHELAHIKRADYLINIVQSFVEITLFFNPFVQLLGRTIKHERENSCDDWVLQFQYNPAMYAEALLRIAYVQTGNTLAMNASGNKGDLLPRVKRMLNQQEKTNRYRNQVFSLLLITIMLSTVAWLQPVPKNNATTQTASAKQHKVVVEPLTASVDNPLFNPVYFFAKPMQKEIDKAIAIAQEKINSAAPAAIEKAGDILTSITPAMLKELHDITLDFGDEFLKAPPVDENDNADNNQAKEINPTFSFNDSVNITSTIVNLVKTEIDKTDWKKIGADLGNLQVNISDVQKEKIINDASAKLTDAFNKTLAPIIELKAGKNNAQLILQQKQTARRIEDAAKRFEKKIQLSDKTKSLQLLEEKLNKITAPAEKDNDDEDGSSSFYTPVAPSIEAYNMNNIYAVSAYNNLNYSYQFADSIRGLDSAVIIVKHNPANNSSHTKHITVEITGNNGAVKSYEFSVEVYQ